MPNLLLLLIQIAVILLTARVVGLLVRKLRQPQVIGEMIAGILLGPSLFGWVAPELSGALFPPASLGFLNSLSQIGLLLFMFLVGLELDQKAVQGLGRAGIVISQTSIIVPFSLGVLLAIFLYPRLSEETVPITAFSLFLGVAMSITAFPVLARILTERGLTKTPVGLLALTCAAVDDVTAWCILATVMLIVRADDSNVPLWITIGGAVMYLGVAFCIVRPLLHRLAALQKRRGAVTPDVLTGVLLIALASASFTEWLGIHALFGAFLAGVVMPKDHEFVRDVTQKLEDVTVVLLLPLFFAFTGLRTSIELIDGFDGWVLCALIILVAVAGKLGGAAVAARAVGRPWREATAIGVLMNTRGLVELVILNVGLDAKVISPTLFAMMVIMALVTTFLTSPLLDFVYPMHRIRAGQPMSAAIGHRPTSS